MPPPKFAAGGETFVHPVIACAVLLAGALILFLPRRHVIAPLLAATLLIPIDQVVILGPLHFHMLRVLILIGWLRVLAIKMSSPMPLLAGGLLAIDKALALWISFAALDVVLLWHSSAALINQLGALYNVFLVYFLLRFLIRDLNDAERAVRIFAGVAVVVAAVMVAEQATGHNLYVCLGGARQPWREALVQRGHYFRAMAGFGNAILAGVYGATLMPLCAALWWRGRKPVAIIGISAATVIVLASVSSTPALAYLAALLGLCLWPARRHLRLLRWSSAVAVIALHLVMKAPVWALIQRVDVIGSSSGYHRYILVDQFVHHFWDWWLLGARNTEGWGHFTFDIANQFVGVAETSGIVPFISFTAIIVYGFKYLGRARKACEGDRKLMHFIWAVGCALFAHVVAFFGISYFDQMMVAWYALLAIIAVCATAGAQTVAGGQEVRDEAGACVQ